MSHGNTFRGGHLPYWVSRLYDPNAHALTVVTEGHRLAHDGMVFSVTGKATGLADAGTATFLIATGDNMCHMARAELNVGRGDCTLHAYTGTTTSADGTPLTAYNLNRSSSNTATTVISGTPTVTDDGTLLHTIWAPPTATGTGLSGTGLSGVQAGEEWMLAANTKYLYRLTNNSGVAIDYSWDLLFYEITYTDWV